MNDSTTTCLTFEQLYREGCRIQKTEPEHLALYVDLDKLWNHINNQEKSSEKDNFKHALSSDRVCIVIPYEMFRDKRLPPDDIIGEEEVIFACLGFDSYISKLIDIMDNSYGKNIFDGNETLLVKWKLMRLSKVVDLGWDKFVTNYLTTLN